MKMVMLICLSVFSQKPDVDSRLIMHSEDCDYSKQAGNATEVVHLVAKRGTFLVGVKAFKETVTNVNLNVTPAGLPPTRKGDVTLLIVIPLIGVCVCLFVIYYFRKSKRLQSIHINELTDIAPLSLREKSTVQYFKARHEGQKVVLKLYESIEISNQDAVKPLTNHRPYPVRIVGRCTNTPSSVALRNIATENGINLHQYSGTGMLYTYYNLESLEDYIAVSREDYSRDSALTPRSQAIGWCLDMAKRLNSLHKTRICSQKKFFVEIFIFNSDMKLAIGDYDMCLKFDKESGTWDTDVLNLGSGRSSETAKAHEG
eukprot:TRINITY_DN14895_c1_g1_i1.p1 TRINITY_DN14895_c1_g1~~TRINITY_DN14895_c1_g1_i1.p1  ORF type:complete len:315 (+),score=58.42 TRINITY_DN14895_c1_g1_i1:144-1088(+)